MTQNGSCARRVCQFGLIKSHLSEEESEAHFQTNGTSFGELVHTKVVVDCRLYGYMLVQEEAVTYLGRQLHVIVVGGAMFILQTNAQIDAILLDVIAGAGTNLHVVHIGSVLHKLMVIAKAAIQHPIVHYKETAGGLHAEGYLLVLAVGQIQPRERGVEVRGVLFKLCRSTQRKYCK